MNFLFYLFVSLFVLISLILTMVILVQKGRGGGLSGAFGGGGGGSTAFGAKTGDMLTWATSIIFGLFLLLAIALNLMSNYKQDQLQKAAEQKQQQQDQQQQQPPAAPEQPQ